MIEWALNWYNGQRNKYLTETVTIKTSTGIFNVKATVIGPSTEVNSAGIRSKTDKVKFIINSADISAEIQRGVQIVRPNYGVYEVIIDRMSEARFNDPNKLEIVIPARLICS